MRFALGVEYDGSGFSGWQRQGHTLGVQQCVEEALARVADHPLNVQCAGRTDAGVHAVGQVIHFDSEAPRRDRAWLLGGNANLPPGISFTWAMPVSDGFHARYSATARRYRYLILNRPARPGVMARRVSWEKRALDAERMQRAAQALLGEHDFSSYRAQGCQSRTPMRCVQEISLERRGDYLVLEIEANAFLHHMVRNIAGVLIDIGAGLRPEGWAAEVLELRDRALGGVTAPPFGLYLMAVRYPPEFGLPAAPTGPLLP